MILTFKVKHNRNFSSELKKARQIAEVAMKTKTQTTADVKHYGLKSIIANQILREYARNRKLKRVGNVNLIVPSQGISVKEHIIRVPSLRLDMQYRFTELQEDKPD